MSGKPRASFVTHPSAKFFRAFLRIEFFVTAQDDFAIAMNPQQDFSNSLKRPWSEICAFLHLVKVVECTRI